MLYRLEHWEELDDEEKEAMETLKFIEKAHQLLHEHDHLGLGDDHDHHDHEDDNEGEYQKESDNDSPIADSPIDTEPAMEAIKIEGEAEGGFMAVAADPDAAHKELQNAPSLDLESEGQALGFDLQQLAGAGTVVDELRRLYNYVTQVSQQYRCPQDKIDFVGTDKKYFMDFSYPVCFDTEKFWKPDEKEGCLVYSFGVDDNWKFAEGMVGHKCTVHAFDPNMYDEEDGAKDNKVIFHKIGVGNKNADDVVQPGKRDYKYRSKYGDAKLDQIRARPMRTLWGVMRELGHTDRILDVVKIDREGPRKAYEPPVLRNLLEDGTYACIRHLVFELHLFGPLNSADEIRGIFSMLKGLENVGLKLYRSQASKTKSKLESVDDFLTLQNEKNTFMYVLSWLNPKPTICH